MTVPILVAQLLLLTGIIIGLYVGWLRISASDHNAAVKTTLIMLLSVLWGGPPPLTPPSLSAELCAYRGRYSVKWL